MGVAFHNIVFMAAEVCLTTLVDFSIMFNTKNIRYVFDKQDLALKINK